MSSRCLAEPDALIVCQGVESEALASRLVPRSASCQDSIVVKVYVEARNDETSPGYVKLQGETWELNVWATTDDLWKLADIEATDWSQRRLLAVGRCARAPVWWHEEDGTVYIIVSEDYEAWDLCVAVPLATVRSLLDELGEPPEKPQQPWGPTLFLGSRHPTDAREELRVRGCVSGVPVTTFYTGSKPRPLARGRCRARRPTPGDCPRFPWASGCSPLRRSPAPRLAKSVRVTRPTVPTILSPCKDHSQGRSRWSRLRRRTNRAALDSDLPRQTHWHLSGWTGQSETLFYTRPGGAWSSIFCRI